MTVFIKLDFSLNSVTGENHNCPFFGFHRVRDSRVQFWPAHKNIFTRTKPSFIWKFHKFYTEYKKKLCSNALVGTPFLPKYKNLGGTIVISSKLTLPACLCTAQHTQGAGKPQTSLYTASSSPTKRERRFLLRLFPIKCWMHESHHDALAGIICGVFSMVLRRGKRVDQELRYI